MIRTSLFLSLAFALALGPAAQAQTGRMGAQPPARGASAGAAGAAARPASLVPPSLGQPSLGATLPETAPLTLPAGTGATALPAPAAAPETAPTAAVPATAAAPARPASAAAPEGGLPGAPPAAVPAAPAADATTLPDAAAQRFRELGAEFQTRDPGALPVDAGAAQPAPVLAPAVPAAARAAAATPRSTQGPLFVEKKGVQHPLGYNPSLPIKPLWREVWDWVSHIPSRLGAIRRYMRRVNELVDALTDEDLKWSLYRFEALENQEGILRKGNAEIVNNWKKWTGPSLLKVAPDDFTDSSVSRITLRKVFKQAMDREEPTLSYQYTSAMNLHNYMPRVAHFMGITMQERIISVALTGVPPARSVWATEEVRHGPIMERVYNLSRLPGQPELKQQGISPSNPKRGEYSARSMLANRSFAEIGAGTGYLFLKANARKDSPADLALEGIFRDEVYHYVLMDAARKWGFGHRNRWARLRDVLRHQFDNALPEAVDTVVHERGGISPLAVFEIAYAFFAIDKRVARYLDTIPDDEGRRLVGKVYQNEQEVLDAIKARKHTWTDAFPIEVNPDLTPSEIRELERRFPTRFAFKRRTIRTSQIREILGRYRYDQINNPDYWMRRKGYAITDVTTDRTVMTRKVGDGDSAVALTVIWSNTGDAPTMFNASAGSDRNFLASIDDISLKQLGLIFNAAGADVIEKLNSPDARKDATAKEIAEKLSTDAAYRKEPIRVHYD